MDEQTYHDVVEQLKCISNHLEAIKLESRESRRAEQEFRRELLDAIGLVQMAAGR